MSERLIQIVDRTAIVCDQVMVRRDAYTEAQLIGMLRGHCLRADIETVDMGDSASYRITYTVVHAEEPDLLILLQVAA
jgi:hypothetical protein